MHPGAHVGDGEAEGLRRISQGLARLFEQLPRSEVRILLETTAGQGTSLGYRFEHLAEIMDRCGGRERLGICLDTCHVFAAGYDFRDAAAYGRLMAGVDEIVGLHHLKVIHINDSKRDLGSRVDRHEHPGCGKIGHKGLSFFLRDIRLKNLPMLIETPKGRNKAGVDWDVINLNLLRKWMEDKQAR
jgi:deoxyribonuclease-4